MAKSDIAKLIYPDNSYTTSSGIGGVSFVTIFIIVGIIISIFIAIYIFFTMKKWNKKFETGEFEPELISKIDERIKQEGIPKQDFFQNTPSIQTMPWNIKNIKYFSAFNDLFTKKDKNPLAITELRYTFSLPWISYFNGIFITKTKKDLIKTIVKKGIFSVYLNNKYVGYVNIRNKEIVNSENKKIGRMEFPEIYPIGITEILWDIYFGNSKKCSIVASLPFIKSEISEVSPIYKYDIAKFFNSLTKEEKALILPVIFFIKIKQSMNR